MYYKVVNEIAGRYFSALTIGSAQIEYKVGEWVKPVVKGSPILIFDNKNAASDFVQNERFWSSPIIKNLRVFSCEARDVSEPFKEKIYCFDSVHSCEDIVKFWTMPNVYENREKDSWPPGTLYARQIKIQ